MSRFPSTDEGSPPLPPEKEKIPTKRATLILTLTLMFFAASVLFVWKLLGKEEQQLLPSGPPRTPAELNKAKVGIVEQRLFSLSRRGLELRTQQLNRLRTYGWVDREKGIVHIPIERAMDQFLEESKP